MSRALLIAILLGAPEIQEAELDPVAAEKVSDEAVAAGKIVCHALLDSDPSAAAKALSSAFRGGGPGGEENLDVAAFGEAMATRYRKAALVRRCSFKPFNLVTDKAHQRAEGRFMLVVGGLDKDGKRFGDRGDVTAVLERGPDGLRFVRMAFDKRVWIDSGVPEFTDVTAEVGVASDFSEELPIELDTAGNASNSGISLVDYDGDGDIDIYVVRDGRNLLYRNDGDGKFTEVAHAAGVDDPGNGRQALFADFDNDGDLDLLVLNHVMKSGSQRGNHLYRNDGNGKFTDVTAGSGAGQIGQFITAVAGDLDGDGLLDVYVTQYQVRGGGDPKGHNPLDAHDGKPNLLLHNETKNGVIKFRDVAKQSGVAGREWSLAAVVTDLDGDRKPEIVVANDYGAPRAYHNLGNLKFEEVTGTAGLDDPGNGMGLDVGDFDGDGKLDLYHSKMYSKAGNRLLSQALQGNPKWLDVARRAARGNSLFRNVTPEGGPLKFEEVGEPANVRRGQWAWSAEFADIDNDGDQDLYVTNGFYTGEIEDDY